MNCEECQESISAFLDCDLDDVASNAVRKHLALCSPCAKVCEDFAAIVDSCRVDSPAEIVPPNAQAVAGFAGVAIISSLLTIVGIRNYFEPVGEDFTSRSASSQTTFEKLMSK